MNRCTVSILVIAWALLLPASSVWGQKHEVCCLEYEAAKEMTAQGVVEKVETRFDQTTTAETHLTVRVGQDLYDVHLGPKRWVKKQKVAFAEGDAITMVFAPVAGAERAAGGPLEVVARQITRGDQTLVLREADGSPRWRSGTT